MHHPSPHFPSLSPTHTMQDPFPIPSCFSSSEKFPEDPASAFNNAAKSGQSIVTSSYRTKISGHFRIISITWCRNLLNHGLCVSIENSSTTDSSSSVTCKVELKPWSFWRKHGSRRLHVDGGGGGNSSSSVQVFWDLRRAKFCGEPEPRSGFHVAVVCNNEIVLLLGDLVQEAYKKTCCQRSSSIIEAILVSKKEHVFGKKKFTTRMKFNEKGKHHEIVIECGSGSDGKLDPQMVVKIDGQVMISVKHLQWKFRGNETISLNKTRVEVYWDVHDWLFSPGLRNALFIFKPLPAVHSSMLTCPSSTTTVSGTMDSNSFCLFLYAWKIE